MPHLTDLPPDLLLRLARWCSPPALAALSRTSRALLAAALPALYARLVPQDPTPLTTVALSARCAAVVRQLSFYPRGHAPLEWWPVLSAALNKCAPRLELLTLVDLRGGSAWVLGGVAAPRLVNARLQVGWGPELSAFLAAAPALEELTVGGGYDDRSVPQFEIPRGALQRLRVYDGPLQLVAALDPMPPLTHVRGRVETLDVLDSIPALARASQTLCSLAVVHNLGSKVSTQILELIAIHCPQIAYFGIVSLPCKDRTSFHRRLTTMRSLHVLELDLGTWTPQPYPTLQRALAMELRTFCPSLQCVSFWMGEHRFMWTVYPSDDENEIAEWENEHEAQRNPLADGAWRLV